MKSKKKLIVGVSVVLLLLAIVLLSRLIARNRDNKAFAVYLEDYIGETLGVITDEKAGTDEEREGKENESGFLPEMKARTASDEITELIFSRTQVQLVKYDGKTCTLSITSPDCASLYDKILESPDELDRTDFVSAKAYVLERFRQEPESGSIPYITMKVELEVIKTGDQYELVETEEYIDALYGGLITYFRDLTESIRKEGNPLPFHHSWWQDIMSARYADSPEAWASRHPISTYLLRRRGSSWRDIFNSLSFSTPALLI